MTLIHTASTSVEVSEHFIVERAGRYWIESRGWATEKRPNATRYSERDARVVAIHVHGHAVAL